MKFERLDFTQLCVEALNNPVTDSLLATNFINKPDVYSTRSHSSNGGHKSKPVGYRGHITTNQPLSLYPSGEIFFLFRRVGDDKGKYDALFLISINYQHPSGEAQIKILIWQINGDWVSSFMNQDDLIQSQKSPKAKMFTWDQPNCPSPHFLHKVFMKEHWRFNRVQSYCHVFPIQYRTFEQGQRNPIKQTSDYDMHPVALLHGETGQWKSSWAAGRQLEHIAADSVHSIIASCSWAARHSTTHLSALRVSPAHHHAHLQILIEEKNVVKTWHRKTLCLPIYRYMFKFNLIYV